MIARNFSYQLISVYLTPPINLYDSRNYLLQQALIKDTEESGLGGKEDNSELDNVQLHVQWPPTPQIVFNSTHKPAGKGILCQSVG